MNSEYTRHVTSYHPACPPSCWPLASRLSLALDSDQVALERIRSYAYDGVESEDLLTIIAGSICKSFSSMGDGARLVGKHVAWFKFDYLAGWTGLWAVL